MTKSLDQFSGTRGEETRRRLVAATIDVVAERGWDAATTRRIAARAGSKQALINYHFGSKEGLLRAAAEAALQEGFQGPLDAMLAAPSFVEGCMALVHALAAFDEGEPIVRFATEALARAPRDPVLRQTMATLLAELRLGIADGVAEAQRRGEVPASLDPKGTALLLAGIFDGLGLHLLVDPTLDVDAAAGTVRQLLTGGEENTAS